MSFQAYLDAVEKKTGLTPRQLVERAHERGFGPDTKATPILEWLKQDYDLGRGHGMALVHVITKGPKISDVHVGRGGAHGDATDTLWLDGAASNPQR
ncbi:DUF4287 domain-containing protein [Microbacterium sp. ACRRU]|jgi:hypothetical protein|uniref:DUF4287 domain-containing protein n=1 Tax=Microbacterium TaxID=33882 RepID=UPI001EF71AF4|nr:DUF4287 domain-containing protein [Microbacterium sp. ACRRU]MCG7418356.1 DUF4287 domain-containing protein [Microbacterium sp. ACRRU]